MRRCRQIEEIRAYWEALRGSRDMPGRAEVNPRGIEGALDCAFLAERVAPGIARFRLAGQCLTDLMGMDVRGMPLTTFFTAPARAPAMARIEAVCADPGTAVLDLVADTGFGRPPLQAAMLLLPLRSDLGDVSRILGCLAAEGGTAEGGVGRPPRRFAIAAARCETLPGGRAPATQPAWPMPGLADPPAAFLPATPEARRAMIRLVKTDEGG
ncbi:PAS domain-containing protein [Frigidibacter oleivorans]|uniref:PAS domain-containing protein n=1 Tax=Frigidibacter oleivorans TaxID=2487129 RepID=UPI000F8E17BD|nr:PAS domain-containing protein [Frigidibacter oleivorans]